MRDKNDPQFDEATIMRIARESADIMRTNAVVASRLRSFGLPKGATLSDTADYLDEVLAELTRRREADDGKLTERLVAFAKRFGLGYKGITHIDSIFDALEDQLKVYRSFRALMDKLGRWDVITKIENDADNS